MKKRMFLFAVLSFSVLSSPAQKVYKEGGKFIFEAAGMPSGCYTRTLKPRTTDGTNTLLGSNTAANLSSKINNEKIAYRFEIAASDNSTSLSWLEAVNLCAGLSGGNWRLPTQRELIMIWIMQEKMKTLPGFTAFSTTKYWSTRDFSDSISSNASTYVIFGAGYVNGTAKTNGFNVRCIRDF